VGNDFASIWSVSFVIAFLGVAALWLLVPRAVRHTDTPPPPPVAPARPLLEPRFIALTACATLLAVVTISDAFVYLLLQEKTGVAGAYLPLFYVATAASYMAFSVPVGRIADRIGRRTVLLLGYLVLAAVYALLAATSEVGRPLQLACLALLGLYYAGTEGILVALASTVAPSARRATGIAVLVSCIGLGKLMSSLWFGWIWQTFGTTVSLVVFLGGLLFTVTLVAVWLGGRRGA
jgi:predicted MFS family arabinose efflux permease